MMNRCAIASKSKLELSPSGLCVGAKTQVKDFEMAY
jgi:hypothetical protein